MNKVDISLQLNTTADRLLELIVGFNHRMFNTIPFEESWTAGQVAQHILLFTSGFEQVLNGKVADTTREPDQLVERIRTTFLDFSTRMKSPDFVTPPEGTYEPGSLSQEIRKNIAAISETVATLDLTKTCTSFQLPVYGYLTRLEAIYFVIYHMQRHTRQLENIKETLAGDS